MNTEEALEAERAEHRRTTERYDEDRQKWQMARAKLIEKLEKLERHLKDCSGEKP